MRKLLDRVTLTVLCLLSIVLVSTFVVKNWHELNPEIVVHAQSSSSTPIQTIVFDKTQSLDAIEVLQVLEGVALITPGDPSDQDMRWLEPQGVRAGAPQIRSAYKFQASDSWLKGLTLVLRNRTSKNIVRADFIVTFPETAATVAMVAPRVRFGRFPASVAFFANGQPIPVSGDTLLLAPGQAMGFNLGNYDSQLRGAIESRQPFSTVSITYLHFDVSFDDGTIWAAGGGYAAPDPQFPGKYLPMDRTYFPGPLMGSPAE